jgi:hypothetical protein
VGGLDAALRSSRERRSVTAAGEKLALRSQDGCLHGFRPWLAVFRLSSIGSFERASTFFTFFAVGRKSKNMVVNLVEP